MKMMKGCRPYLSDFYRRGHEDLMRDHLTSLIEDFYPSLLITITLHSPKDIADEHRHVYYNETQNERLRKDLINRIDYVLYGRKHRQMWDQDKFKYIYRLETKSRRNTRTMPHVHILMSLDYEQRDELDYKKSQLVKKLKKLCQKMGLRGDVDYRHHKTASFNNYILKFPLADIQNIHFRPTLK